MSRKVGTRALRGNENSRLIVVPKVGQVSGAATKTNAPPGWVRRLFLWVPDDVLLSHGIHRTIIGAEAFHGPVRNGKGWDHLAMVVRRSLELPAVGDPPCAGSHCSKEVKDMGDCIRRTEPITAHGYRIKPHGQLVPVSSKDYSSYTSGLLTR